MKLKIFLTAFVFSLLVSLPSLVHAQGDPGPDPDPGTGVPFDGGISLLIAAGIGYKMKKAHDKKKKEQAATEYLHESKL